jgi:hypothetical protein
MTEVVKGNILLNLPKEEEGKVIATPIDSSIDTSVTQPLIPSAPETMLPIASVAPFEPEWFDSLILNKIPNVKVDKDFDVDLHEAHKHLVSAEKYALPFLQYQKIIRDFLNLELPSGLTQIPLEQIERISRIFKYINFEGVNTPLHEYGFKTDPSIVTSCIMNMYKNKGKIQVFSSSNSLAAEDHIWHATDGLATFLRPKKVPLGGSNLGAGGNISLFLEKMDPEKPVLFAGLMKVDTRGFITKTFYTNTESTEGYVPIGLLPNGTFTDFKQISNKGEMSTKIFPSFIREIGIEKLPFIIFESSGVSKFPDTRESKTTAATARRVTKKSTKYLYDKAKSGSNLALRGTKRMFGNIGSTGARTLKNTYKNLPTVSFNRASNRSSTFGGSRRRRFRK